MASEKNNVSLKYEKSTTLQKYCAFTAILLAIIAVLLVYSWMSYDNDPTYLGGLNFNQLIFNYHPIFMVCGLILSFTCSLTSFRLLPLSHIQSKYLHAFLHTVTLIFIILGLSAVFIGNNYPSMNPFGTYSANLYSLHSFLGLAAICLYGSNYVVGFVSFLLYERLKISLEFRSKLKPYHVLLGIFTLFAAVFAVETGVMELSTELGCTYEVTSADLNPAVHYNRLGGANGLGIVVFLIALFTFFTLYDIPEQKAPENPHYEISTSNLKSRVYTPPSMDDFRNSNLSERLIVLGLPSDTKL